MNHKANLRTRYREIGS